MPRDISPAALAYLSGNKDGVDPCCILEVNWAGQTLIYAEKYLPGIEIAGLILDIPTLDTTVKLDGSSDSAFCTIKLDDADGKLKNLYDTADIYNRPATLYQWFEGVSYSDKFPIVEGFIGTPVTWDEGQRTFTIAISTKVFSREVGFSIEDANAPDGWPQDLVGKAWPMGFGRPKHAPTLLLNPVPQLYLLSNFGLPDPALLHQQGWLMEDLSNIQDAKKLLAFYVGIAHSQGDTQAEDAFNQQLADAQLEEQRIRKDLDDLAFVRLEQAKAAGLPGGPIGGAKEYGSFTAGCDLNGYKCTAAVSNGHGGCQLDLASIPTPKYDDFNREVVFTPGFLYFTAGTQLNITSGYEMYYVYNIIPSTVYEVKAYRSVNGIRKLVGLPRGFWSLETVNFGTVQGYAVKTKGPASQLTYEVWKADENKMVTETMGFEDDIYVTYRSSVGPNVADIIQYLIETYSELEIDAASFATAHALLANYPANFVLFDRRDVLDLCKDIAYQARCALYIKNGKIYLKYLSYEESPSDSISDADILMETLVLSTTDDLQLTTVYEATWTDDYAKPQPNRTILRTNVTRYGRRKQTKNFFIYQHESLVAKSVSFWLIRDGNIWKKAAVKLPINKLSIDTYDTITFNVLGVNCPAQVNASVYNLESNTVDLDLWLPIRIGESQQNPIAWPSQISTETLYPIIDDVVSGNAVGYTPKEPRPSGNAPGIQINYVPRNTIGTTHDDKPSDLDDTPPEESPIEDEQVTVIPPPTGGFFYTRPKPFNISVTAKWMYYGKTIRHKGGNDYEVDIYHVVGGKPERVIAKQLQVADSYTFPADRWTLILRMTDPDDSSKSQYFMQLPVWQK